MNTKHILGCCCKLYYYFPPSNVLTQIAGYPNVESLSGVNGVKDVLSKVKYWDFTN